MENEMKNKALFIIVNAGFAESVLDIARDIGIGGATIMNARGEGTRHKSFMGITIDDEREIIVTITDETTAKKAMTAIKEQVGINTPAHSMCFTMPIEYMTGISV
jgi:nitrogen regulatory protein PII